MPPDFDAFYEVILWDEFGRIGGANVLYQMNINSMALPPIINFGSKALKDRVVRDVVVGAKHICLAISEPAAGSDVAGLRATAVKTPDGKAYVVNGQKKWITGGMMADYFMTVVRTGAEDSGSAGLSLLCIDRHLPGVSVRKMGTQFDNTHSTTFVNLDDVVVPVECLIGEEGKGFRYVTANLSEQLTMSDLC